ncbi:hypothetical protein [Streptomyces chromofuscus]|uniref:Integral membrane protein n=1 Tax=Streptomyces chromofuscus TaxID=42881 RepID=A0A7M2TFU3_STRCW|nr:hypothetical protein [Streptomyces chromofuscus]QOV47074.1 hypothetical protein IPT68_15055 [Streptomyces chromofuscus]GGT26156.1 hypothetical protein GCM10010254_53240 [Streptomyces chromofuscus]
MHGHGYPQPVKQPPPTAWLVLVRVLFVVIALLSLGFLTWAMLLRLAIVTRKSLDWGLFVAVLAIDILAIVLLGTEPGDEIHTVGGWTGLALLLGTLVGAIAYYLAAEVRHFHLLRHGGGYAPSPAQAYGYPQPQPQPQPQPPTPYTTGTALPQPPLPHNAPGPHTPPPTLRPTTAHPPISTPPPQCPAPARIDQVRAELDELSDYLRKQGGQQGGEEEGGR